MKGFINKRDKIKWEDTPFQPEFTDARIKKVIDANVPPIEVATPANGDILSYDSTSEKWVNTAPPAGNLEGLTDVAITTPANGDTLEYDSTSSKWVNVAAPVPEEWELAYTQTFNGTSSTYTYSLVSEKPSKIMLYCNFKATTDAASVRVFVSHAANQSTRLAYLSSVIGTAERFATVLIERDANLWVAEQWLGATDNTVANVTRLVKNFEVDSRDVISITMDTTSGNFPEDSTIAIYIKH